MNKRRRYSVPLSFRCSPELLARVQEAAALAEVPLSSWMRERLARAARGELGAAGRPGPGRRGDEEDEAMADALGTEASVREWLGRLSRELYVAASAAGVCEVRMLRGRAKPRAAAGSPRAPLARRAEEEIREYLAGRRTAFGVRADLSALTPFTRGVLEACARIPYGETRSYAWVAREAGRPRAARAAGQALGRNPVPLVVP